MTRTRHADWRQANFICVLDSKNFGLVAFVNDNLRFTFNIIDYNAVPI